MSCDSPVWCEGRGSGQQLPAALSLGLRLVSAFPYSLLSMIGRARCLESSSLVN